MNILLLAGGSFGEREVSLWSGQAVARAFDELGYDYNLVDPKEPDFDITKHLEGVDLVFVAMHGRGGEDGTYQRILEEKGIPFVGSGSKASELCTDKWAFKKLLNDNGIRTPKGELVSLHRMDSLLFDKPYVLKPCDEGSSLDTQIVRNPSPEAFAESKRLLGTHEEMLIEELITGHEITVGILENKALPVIEVIPPVGREFDYQNKYNGESQELCPPKNISDDLQKQAQELTEKIHALAGCKDLSRTDIIIDQDDRLYVLETNTLPGMTEQSLYPKMGAAAGYSWSQLIEKLCALAD